jgi:hypothetical protein
VDRNAKTDRYASGNEGRSHVPSGRATVRTTSNTYARKAAGSDLGDEDEQLPPEFLCEEYRPKQVGDACASDSDCEPFTVTGGVEGNIVVVHLACDLDAGQCAEIAPPEVEGVGDSCNLTPADVAEFYGYGSLVLVDALDCATGLCVVDALHDNTCVPQSCSIRCTTDRDCPQGTLCLEARDEASDAQGYEATVCVEAFVVDAQNGWQLLECPDENGATP